MLFFILNASGQTIIDSCYNSTAPNTNFFSSSTLANYSQGFSGHANADLLEWNGTNCDGKESDETKCNRRGCSAKMPF